MLDIKELERIILENQAKTINVEGRTLVFGEFREIKQPKYRPEKLEFSELSSIVTMIKEDAKATKKLYVHIETPHKVTVFTEEDKECERDCLYTAKYSGTQFCYGQNLDYESFIIALRAKFIETEDRNKLIALIASVKNVADSEISDNGITQTATTKQGAGLVSTGEVKAIYTLKPYRTFSDIEQTAAEYLFRIRKHLSTKELLFSIHEADGGRWELEQKSTIAQYFEQMLSLEISDKRVVIVK